MSAADVSSNFKNQIKRTQMFRRKPVHTSFSSLKRCFHALWPFLAIFVEKKSILNPFPTTLQENSFQFFSLLYTAALIFKVSRFHSQKIIIPYYFVRESFMGAQTWSDHLNVPSLPLFLLILPLQFGFHGVGWKRRLVDSLYFWSKCLLFFDCIHFRGKGKNSF